MKHLPLPRNPGVTMVLLASSLALLLAGCAKQQEVNRREDRPINAQVENLGTSIKIIRKDPFPWHNVTFVLDRFYEYRDEFVDQQELEIPYDSFIDHSGEPYDIPGGQPFRLRIFADEGRWPHPGAHN
jgi:hypothetical protein